MACITDNVVSSPTRSRLQNGRRQNHQCSTAWSIVTFFFPTFRFHKVVIDCAIHTTIDAVDLSLMQVIKALPAHCVSHCANVVRVNNVGASYSVRHMKTPKLSLVTFSTKLRQLLQNLAAVSLNKIVTNWCEHFPLHLNSVSTLPCERKIAISVAKGVRRDCCNEFLGTTLY